MKRIYFILVFVTIFNISWTQWKPQGEKIKTEWTTKVDPNAVHQEYPRPIMERSLWQNLNGLWDYAILPSQNAEPAIFQGKILVPFAVESSLSGVMKDLGKDNLLWYKKSFTIPSSWKKKDVLLNFGAVDWKAYVWLNDIKIGSHSGGYAPFSFNITPFLKAGGEQNLVVSVWDPTNDGPQPRGKQIKKPESIWYTPVSGIWQTVWIEAVEKSHFTQIYTIPNIDVKRASVNVSISSEPKNAIVEVKVSDNGKQIGVFKSVATEPVEIVLDNLKLWSPESPFLYDLEVSLYVNGVQTDVVKSYFAMRKISTARDKNGIVRLQLNNKDYFQFGPLDQGWWPDGLYTAPSDEALVYDIKKTKELGFNMIRKHVKVEPARWYTHCDKLGMLVWQDMPHGDGFPGCQMHNYYNGNEPLPTPEWENIYRKEWEEIIYNFRVYPSIVTWVPFNEGWGQFKTPEIAAWTKQLDPTRLVNPASGGSHFQVGDILDLHNYPGPELYLYDAQRATVMGEYGGIGYAVEGHLWKPDNNWGYIQFKSSKEVTDSYVGYANELIKLIHAGLSAAVYTQTTDVEIEVNGLMTYDRKIVKVEADRIKKINDEVTGALK